MSLPTPSDTLVPNQVGELEPNDSEVSNETDYYSDDDYEPDEIVPQLEEVSQLNDQPRRPTRNPKPNRMDDYVYTAFNQFQNDPATVEEALQGPDAVKWTKAMEDEYSSLIENDTWTLVDLPSDRKPIQSKWVFKMKCQSDGTTRYKARLVIKGCAQRKGIDFEETYAPVVRYSSIRYLMSLAVQYDMHIDQMDAVTAFLQGDLKEDIYMVQPETFSIGDKCCKLKKAIYGLKQASRAWNSKLHTNLIQIGMNQSKVDRCVYYKIENKKKLFVAVYVDDLLIFSTDANMTQQLKTDLQSRFKMKDIGELKNCLGFKVARDRKNNVLWIDQSEYIQQILLRFNMLDCNPVSTPLDVNIRLDKTMCPKNKAEHDQMQNVPYQEAVGCLLYAAQSTRPDIAYAVNLVSRYNNNPGRQHWNAVKHILRYLKGTLSYKLEYKKSADSELNLHGYSDADWASDVDERKSTTGYIFLRCNGAITWNSRKQQTVALSTTEAEYMALSAATQEAIYLQKLETELNENTGKGVRIYCDNRSAINLAHTDTYHARTISILILGIISFEIKLKLQKLTFSR